MSREFVNESRCEKNSRFEEHSVEARSSQCPFHGHQLLEREPQGGRFGGLLSYIGRLLNRLVVSSDVPENKRPPLVKSTPWFGALHTQRYHPFDLLSEGLAHCGPVFRYERWGRTTNVITGPEAIRVAKESQQLDLDRKNIFGPFGAIGVPIFEAEGDRHELLRRLVRFGYARSTVSPFVGRMSDQVRESIQDWPADLKLGPRMAEVAAKAVMATFSPQPLPFDLVAIGEVGELGMKVSLRQLPKIALMRPKVSRVADKTVSIIDPVIQRHRDGLTKDDPLPWMIDAFMAAKAGDEQLDDLAVRGGILYAIIASHIYLGRQAFFMLAEAARDPQTLEAVKTEVDTAFSQGPLNADVLRRMPTLRALFVETNRRYPMITGMPYETTRPIEVGGFTLGSGEFLLVTAVPNHFDGNIYSCPWSFDQRRVRQPRNEHLARGAYAPWGFPPRSCLAVGLCELVSTTVVATILHEFDVSIPNASETILVEMAPLVGPIDGQPARVRRRVEADRRIDPSALYEEKIRTRQWDDQADLPEFDLRIFEPGEAIVVQGDPADAFYIVLDGNAVVTERGDDDSERQVNTLGPGDAFGEIGLLKRTPRTATVRAVDRIELLVMDGESFLQLAADMDEDAAHLAQFILDTFISRSFRKSLGGVRENELPELGGIRLRAVDDGEFLIREGDQPDFAYIVTSGRAEVFRTVGDHCVILDRIGPGEICGEIGVLESRPREASIRAIEPTTVAVFNREAIESLVEKSPVASSGLRLLISRRLTNIIEQLDQKR